MKDVPITLATNVLVRGLDDWVMACDVVAEIVESGIDVDDESVSQLSFQIIEHLILNELMEAGDVSDDGFVPWSVNPPDAMSLIRTEWRKLDRLPNLGEVCWLRNKTLGDEIG